MRVLQFNRQVPEQVLPSAALVVRLVQLSLTQVILFQASNHRVIELEELGGRGGSL